MFWGPLSAFAGRALSAQQQQDPLGAGTAAAGAAATAMPLGGAAAAGAAASRLMKLRQAKAAPQPAPKHSVGEPGVSEMPKQHPGLPGVNQVNDIRRREAYPYGKDLRPLIRENPGAHRTRLTQPSMQNAPIDYEADPRGTAPANPGMRPRPYDEIERQDAGY